MGPLTKLFVGRRAMNAQFVDRNGQCVVYPYWIFGRGVILNQDQKALWEKHNLKFVELFLWIFVLCVIIFVTLITALQTSTIYRQHIFLRSYMPTIFLGSFYILYSIFLGPFYIFYSITSRKFLVGAKRTSKKFTLREHVEQVTEFLSWPTIILGILGMVIINLMLLYFFTLNFETISLQDIIVFCIYQVPLLFLLVMWAKILFRKLRIRGNSAKPD